MAPDDGHGFEPGKTASDERALLWHGLRNMRRRARELGAHLDLDASPGGGARLRLKVPDRVRRRPLR